MSRAFMNKHTKTALFVAPFLILGGYILSDIYIESQALKDKVIALKPDGFCDVLNDKCILKSGELKINVYDKAGTTIINSTFQLDKATFFLVDEEGVSTSYNLKMADSPFYWEHKTKLRAHMPNKGDSYKLRLIAEIKGGKYISEFYTQRYQ